MIKKVFVLQEYKSKQISKSLQNSNNKVFSKRSRENGMYRKAFKTKTDKNESDINNFGRRNCTFMRIQCDSFFY